MRILTVMNLYPPHSYGGYEDLCAGAVAHWRAAGHHVEVLASDWRRPDVPDGAPSPSGEPVARALPVYWDLEERVSRDRRRAVAWERRARRVVTETLDRVRPDVVAVWNAAALSLSVFDLVRARGVPVVLVILDRWLEFGPASDGWRARFLDGSAPLLDRVVGRLAGLPMAVGPLGEPVVACFASQHLADHAHEETAWHFDDEVIVPHGVDRTRYGAGDRLADRPWGGRLLFVGRLAPEKGVETAIRGAAAVPGVHLDVIGTGTAAYEDRMRRVIDELDVGDRVRLRGEGGPAEIGEALAGADALVFPSQWPEPFGIVPLEAMAAGVPVLGTGTGGSGEFLVDDVTCLRFASRDAEALAHQVRRLADDTALRARLHRNGLAAAAWLDRARANDELLEWLGYAAGRLDGPRPRPRDMLPPDLEA